MKRCLLCTLLALAAVTFMLRSEATRACTGIELKAKDGAVVTGRTVEFGFYIETHITVVPRGHEFTGTTPEGAGLTYAAKHGVVGANFYDQPGVVDGLNEEGLAAGAFYFPDFAEYAEITPENQAKAVAPVEFVNWVLTQFGTVEEVRAAVENQEVVIAPTVFEKWGFVPPFHYVVYDKTGASIVIEPVGGDLLVYDNPLGVMTNSPTFDWHMTNLRNYIALSPRNVPPVEISGDKLQQLGQGSGMLGLPGDFTPPSRFVRAAVFSATAVPSETGEEGALQAFHILNNFDIPIGVARDVEANGEVQTDYTMLTVVRDATNLRYYWKTYNDQTIKMVDMAQLDFEAPGIRMISTEGEQPIADRSAELAP